MNDIDYEVFDVNVKCVGNFGVYINYITKTYSTFMTRSKEGD